MTEDILLKKPDNFDSSPDVKQQVASHPQASVWVNASAGSGKTTVLTHRVMRLLLDGVKPEKILCLTYTRAAAAEMSNRVTTKLSFWVTCSDNELSASISDLQGYPPTADQMIKARRLFAQVLSCAGGMRIRTLHAFCQEILRRFPVEANLAPHFTVIEETDARALQDEVLHDLLRDADDDPTSDLGHALQVLVQIGSEHGFDEAMRSVLMERPRLQEALNKAGTAQKLIKQMRDQLQLTPEDTVVSICRAATKDNAFAKAQLRQAGIWLLEGSKSFVPRGERILAWLNEAIDERIEKFDSYGRCFFNADGDVYKNFANKDLLAKYPDLGRILDTEAARLRSVFERLETAQLGETTAAVLTFGAAFIKAFEGRKAAKAVLDYDDLITRTDTLLRRPGIAPWILFKLDGGLDHIMVDEAQDTSRAQWSIVATLANEFFAGKTARSDLNRTLFVVGDEKQSIFSFQRADPEAFLSMRGYFAQRINEAEKTYHEVPMRVSFRSAPAILQAVDKIFAAAHVVSGVSLETVEHQPVLTRAGDAPKIGRVEIWPLQPTLAQDNVEGALWPLPVGYEQEHDPQAELAQQIAVKIRKSLDKKECTPDDIMILLRRRGRFADLMVRALKERDVPVTGVDRMRLIKQLPVMDLLALIQFVLLPEDDLNLATVLRGPLLGLSEDNLMQIAIGRAGTLWQSMFEKKAVATFKPAYDYLMHWLSVADFVTPFALISQILNEKCPGSKTSGKHAIWARLGPDAIDPVEELLNAAQNFSRSHIPSLQSFMHWLTASEADIKRELDRSGGQVRIMTVHASKGLEAPIVFLPDSSGVPRIQDVPKFLWSKDDVPFFASRRPSAGLARSLWEMGRQRQMEEYRRLMYVALTRAAEQLYIAGWETARKEANSSESWYNLAAQALQDMHQPSVAETVEPKPVIAFADPDLGASKKPKPVKEEKPNVVVLPDWVTQSPLKETGVGRTVAPSHVMQAPATATPDIDFARGRIIHRLLQSLPSVEASKRDVVAAKFLSNPQHQLSKEQQQDIQQEVMGILNHPDYAPLFGPASRAEVSLVGVVKGVTMSGQVDRLCPVGDEIWIVDYKTNRPPPETIQGVPEIYRQQLASYGALLQDIYPGKTIRCFLLWTYKLRFMELPAAF